MNFMFFVNSILLGIGLAMDAFSVSLANGLNDTKMNKSKMFAIAGTFAVFQAIMPLLGWICVHTIVEYFHALEKYIPVIALALLSYIGGKMLYEGIKSKDSTNQDVKKLSFGVLIIQGIATSIDALSVGFTIAEYNFASAIICALIIAVVTLAICIGGLIIGKKFGTKLAGKASILGGIILILIGIEIFISGIIG